MLNNESKTMRDKIGYNEQATSFTGKGVNVFAMAVVASGLKLYARTGIRPNRAYTPKAMMQAASRRTGKKYKARDYIGAANDLSELVQTLKRELVK